MKARRSGLACLVLAVAACGGSELERRQTEVAQVGGLVMPFDLERATHVFEKLERGGLQTVVADQKDPEQVALIRTHLAEEARRFSRGDFHDPSMIHGEDMAGLPVGGSAAEYYSISALVRTLGANFPEVRAVQILVDGQPVDSLAGHFDTSGPLDVATWQ